MINWHRDVSCMIVVYITCICRVHESMSKYQFIIYCMHTYSEINLYNTVITVYNRNYIQTAKDSEAVSEEKKKCIYRCSILLNYIPSYYS